MSETKTGFGGMFTLGEDLMKVLLEMHASIIETQAIATMAVELLNGKTAVTKAEVKKDEPIEFKPAEEAIPAEFKEEAPKPVITIDDLRTKVIQVVNNGKKNEVKAIINEYAPKVTEVPADKVAEVYERISALEG